MSSFLIHDLGFSATVNTGLLNGANYISQDKTKLGNRASKELNLGDLETEWYKVFTWEDFAQNRISEPVPTAITISDIEGVFLMGGYYHGEAINTSVPEFDYTESNNIISDVLGSSVALLCKGDYSGSYAFLQTWLFFMEHFNANPIYHTKTKSVEKHIIPFTL